jgi:hypothetical protein
MNTIGSWSCKPPSSGPPVKFSRARGASAPASSLTRECREDLLLPSHLGGTDPQRQRWWNPSLPHHGARLKLTAFGGLGRSCGASGGQSRTLSPRGTTRTISPNVTRPKMTIQESLSPLFFVTRVNYVPPAIYLTLSAILQLCTTSKLYTTASHAARNLGI